MDFCTVELGPNEERFLDRAREFLGRQVTPERIEHARIAGEGFLEDVHLAMGAEGWLEPEAKKAVDGGFTPLQRRIWALECRRARVPLQTWGATMMILAAVQRFGQPELVDAILPSVYNGTVRFAMGYTEPEGGSDIATCKTRAVLAGDRWIINGQKMFTTGAQHCQYVFLLTNSAPGGARHRNLTMFLVPLDTPGIEIQGLRTVDGERTNITFYSDVVVPDRYRIGEVNDGWTVLSGPLAAEHGARSPDRHGLADIAIMSAAGTEMAVIADSVSSELADCTGGSAGYRLGRAHARIEAALSTPGIFGRVAIAQTMRDLAPELMDLMGPTAALGGDAEHLYRVAPLIGIYGGTIDVFRNMIATHVLGLGRPSYARTGKKEST
ncbi:acyl-CoA dehydrogenase [Mycolicibacterium fortuitum]|uniref:Acyl-CoA dehydrogenase n=1 Tax=Mycolicibacterium fortuitum TaxID=1766 RepID=A0A378UBT2_MYCFO|nr:acyl-CoA dehydrogenase [Mycolicibacterium fortuitum]